MEATNRNAEANHEDHQNPAFRIEEGERAILLIFLSLDALRMFVVESSEDEYEEEKEDDGGFAYLEHPVL